MKCCFEIEGKIKGKGRPRFTKYGKFVKAYTPEDTVSYENLIKLQFRMSCGDWYSELPLKMKITAIHGIVKSASKKDKARMLSGELKPTKKPDADNIIKVICDALNHIAYKDDTQVVDLDITKVYGEKEKVIVEIEEIRSA
jgi:Holliday junction resolvase RusA-like endonuclease